MTRARGMVAAGILGLVATSCEDGGTTPAPPPCDEVCQESIALRGVRETMKLVFNLTLQGKPVGEHDRTIPCPLGGTARIFGTATSNPVQGATEVHLTYVLDHCAYLEKDEEPRQNYSLTTTGTIRQNGTIAVQPSTTSALVMKSDAVTVVGTVHAPPHDYRAEACPAELAQNGARLSGKFCQRTVGVDL
ncbi:hypothetical protein [Pendulispora albinea]|uniref:Lipoprotein n=1 Tax=Pendulispora albinea TaxID=2741071 RepID=A0ABZ2M7M0_9BACT